MPPICRTSTPLYAGLTIIVASTLLLAAGAACAADTPEQQCQKARYKAAAKYAACQQKALAKYFGGNNFEDPPPTTKCRVRYSAIWPKLQAKASGTGATCDNVRFEDNGDGTVTDRLTALQWEQKTDDATVHDKDNRYSWSAGGGGFTAADGTAFTGFLGTLNSGGCFAGQCDWRLPTVYEFQTILGAGSDCLGTILGAPVPCIDEGVFGPTAADYYWASATAATYPGSAGYVYFVYGYMGYGFKYGYYYVRAVRGGL